MSHSELRKVTLLFAGDSGDGIQLTGSEFAQTAAFYGNDLRTFPDFPAEIRAPQGTLAGVSGFKINFSDSRIYTPGDQADVLVAMNAAALKKNLRNLKTGGFIVVDPRGFSRRDLEMAGFSAREDALEKLNIPNRIIAVEVSKITAETLKDSTLSKAERDRSKNMFVLGLMYWIYNRPFEWTESFLSGKFAQAPEIAEANIAVLKAGYHYGETAEISLPRFTVRPTKKKQGMYRNIAGNQALSLGLIAAAEKSGMPLFYGSYPITPASDILHELVRHKNFGVRTFQAEDEIAAITSAIGASFGGHLGVTASSGPGISLKSEAIGLAVMLELPLVIVNVQRGGPSTGLPTKTEQSDLLQALYGRNGEAPLPVISARSAADAFEVAFEAARMAIECMTPVILLSDGFIANGTEPWHFPKSADLPEIRRATAVLDGEAHLPYKRDERGVRNWAIPGEAGGEHRIGGLEKEWETGNVSYDPENHERMVNIREAKVQFISKRFPPSRIETGSESGDVLVLGWGSTYGAIREAVERAVDEGLPAAHLHLRHIHPMPDDLGEILRRYKTVLVPELNKGQLVKIIRAQYLIDAQSLNKVQGQPFSSDEIYGKIVELSVSPAKTNLR